MQGLCSWKLYDGAHIHYVYSLFQGSGAGGVTQHVFFLWLQNHDKAVLHYLVVSGKMLCHPTILVVVEQQHITGIQVPAAKETAMSIEYDKVAQTKMAQLRL